MQTDSGFALAADASANDYIAIHLAGAPGTRVAAF